MVVEVELKRPAAETSFNLLGSEMAVGYVLSILTQGSREVCAVLTDAPLIISWKDADTFTCCMFQKANDGRVRLSFVSCERMRPSPVPLVAQPIALHGQSGNRHEQAYPSRFR